VAIATMLRELARLPAEVGRHRPTGEPDPGPASGGSGSDSNGSSLTPDPWQRISYAAIRRECSCSVRDRRESHRGRGPGHASGLLEAPAWCCCSRRPCASPENFSGTRCCGSTTPWAGRSRPSRRAPCRSPWPTLENHQSAGRRRDDPRLLPGFVFWSSTRPAG